MKKILLLAILACTGFVKATPTQPKWNPSLQQRIINGTSGSAPYMVSLSWKPYNSHACGGAILNERWILTAAHCLLSKYKHSGVLLVEERMPQDLLIKTGSNELAAQKDAYDAAKILIHENYNPITSENDIALLKVSSPIKIDNHNIKSIPLGSEVVEEGKTTEMCGWGDKDLCSRTPKNLQCLKQTIISNRKCKESFREKDGSRYDIYDSHICASSPKVSAGCYGDSGSPTVMGGKVIGIVSWGKGCVLGYDEVFTRVSSFISWVNSTMSDHELTFKK